MTSEAAKAVAIDVLTEVGNGRIPNKEQIQLAHGYSQVSARKGKATQTQTYKDTVKPVIDSYENIRAKILAEMESRDIGKERFVELSNALRSTTHDIQLLGGRSTENVAVQGVEITLRR